MRIILITGLLGSGKSTVLLSLAARLSKMEGPKAVVIIENEIGDTTLTSRCAGSFFADLSPVELDNNCICCTLTGELVGLLEDIQSRLNPSWLLVETSILAHQSIKDTIRQTLITNEPLSVLVADAGRWSEMYREVPMLIGTQAERADFILVNKIDTASPAELETVLSDIGKLNPNRPVKTVNALEDDLNEFWDLVTEEALKNGETSKENLKLAQI
ncbi:MAG: hypothetical protein LBR53_12955 [Deltaproteobacteria bacterium]|jgi:G3E family GTPase|nr:hypothetical protein [Deltaproteobacteria bacterium]